MCVCNGKGVRVRPADGLNPGIRQYCVTELCCDRSREHLHTSGEGKGLGTIFRFLRTLLPFSSSSDHASNEAAVFFFEGIEFWERGLNAERLRPPRKHTGNERVDRIVEKLLSHATADKFRDALLPGAAPDKGLLEQPELGPGGEQFRRKKCRGSQRQCVHPAAAEDVPVFPHGVGIEKFVADPAFGNKLPEQRGRFEGAVRTGLRKESLLVNRFHRTPDFSLALEHFDTETLFCEPVSGAETGDPSPNDNDIDLFPMLVHDPPRCRIVARHSH